MPMDLTSLSGSQAAQVLALAIQHGMDGREWYKLTAAMRPDSINSLRGKSAREIEDILYRNEEARALLEPLQPRFSQVVQEFWWKRYGRTRPLPQYGGAGAGGGREAS